MSTTILVAEDQKTTARLIEFKLANAGYKVVVVSDGLSALKTAQSLHPDMIVLDVMMPLMTGFEVLSALKKDPVLRNIPVIILTAQTREEEIVKGLELGADDYILKPFSPNELLARIRTVFLRNKRQP